MRNRRRGLQLAAVGVLGVLGLATPARAQVDVAASGFVAVSTSPTIDALKQDPANGAGYLLEARLQWKRWIGVEATYSQYSADETYTFRRDTCGGPGCGPFYMPAFTVPADAHQVTGDYVVSFGGRKVRPFVAAGAGVLVTRTTPSSARQNATNAVIDFGAGVDLGLTRHLGARLQYRGDVYKATELNTVHPSTEAYMFTSKPAGGLFVRF